MKPPHIGGAPPTAPGRNTPFLPGLAVGGAVLLLGGWFALSLRGRLAQPPLLRFGSLGAVLLISIGLLGIGLLPGKLDGDTPPPATVTGWGGGLDGDAHAVNSHVNGKTACLNGAVPVAGSYASWNNLPESDSQAPTQEFAGAYATTSLPDGDSWDFAYEFAPFPKLEDPEVSYSVTCIDKPAGYHVVKTPPMNAKNNFTATAQCPQGQVALGGGFTIQPPGGTAIVDQAGPTSGGGGWQVHLEVPFGGGTATVAVVCANPLQDYVFVTKSVTAQNFSLVDVASKCAKGSVVLGYGYSTPSGTIAGRMQTYWDSAPSPYGVDLTAKVDDIDKSPRTLSVTAICAKGSA